MAPIYLGDSLPGRINDIDIANGANSVLVGAGSTSGRQSNLSDCMNKKTASG